MVSDELAPEGRVLTLIEPHLTCTPVSEPVGVPA
jgi:hypothetical protein